MRIALTILFLCSVAYGQNVYHVKNGGNDALDGLTDATAWATISKINSTSFNPGDSILFKSDNTWSGTLRIKSSGTQASPIYIGSYGTGNRPLITGFQTQTGFTNVGNIWSVTATNAADSLNLILINGKAYAKGRYPNTGYLTFTSYGMDSSYITGSLTGTPSYAGKECVVRTVPWVLDKREVATQVGGKLTFTKKLSYIPQYGGNGYFFQNDSTFLDTLNEWSFKNSTKKLDIYATSTPTVQISTIDTLVFLSKSNFITIDGISFTGANKKIFQLDTARGVTIKNCSLNYSGSFGIMALKSNLLAIQNDSVQNCFSGAIYGMNLDYYSNPPVNQCDSAVISNNYIKKTGIYEGMGQSGGQRYSAIRVQGNNLGPQIIGNIIDSAGYMGIQFSGAKSLVKNNVVGNVCFTVDDGAAIYTSIGGALPSNYNDSSNIISNIVYNAIGAPLGTTYGIEANGIYLDNNTRRITIDSNTIYNCALAGIFFHQTTNIIFRNNNLFKNNFGLLFAGMSETSSNNMYGTHNSFYSGANSPNGTYSDLLVNANSQHTVFASNYFGTLDSNYYCRPYDESNSFSINSTSYWSLSQWQSNTGLDTHSTITPTGVNKYPVQYLVNALSVPQTFRILGTYIALNGTSYNNYVTLQPYQSITLIKATANDGTAYPVSSLPLLITKITEL